MADTTPSVFPALPALPMLAPPAFPQIDTRAMDTMTNALKQGAAAPLTAVNAMIDATNNMVKSAATATQNAVNSIAPPAPPSGTTIQAPVPVVNTLGTTTGTTKLNIR